MSMRASSASFVPRGLSVATRTGAILGGARAAVPLRAEPTVISRADLMQYESLVSDLLVSIDEDQNQYAIYQSPGAIEAEVNKLLYRAQELDGCKDGLSCPGWSPTEPEPTVESEGSIAAFGKASMARNLRQEAAGKSILAEKLRKRATDQGITNDAEGNRRVLAQIALKKKTSNLRDKEIDFFNRIRGAATVWSSDWNELQDIDLDMQAIRTEYTELTGRNPSMKLPAPAGTVPWGWITAGLVLIGGAMAFGQIRGLLGIGSKAA